MLRSNKLHGLRFLQRKEFQGWQNSGKRRRSTHTLHSGMERFHRCGKAIGGVFLRADVRKRPNEEVMRRILAEQHRSVAGIILRLAWKLALRRDEMHRLTWRDFDFSKKELVLPGRCTPVDEETFAALWERFSARGRQSEFVVISDRFLMQMQPASISRAARQALDAGGQEGISLEDLRQDCIMRWLEEKGVACAARFSGMAVDTLYTNYVRYPEEAAQRDRQQAKVDEFALWQVIQAEGASPVGLVLRLVWQLGLSVTEALELTWEQVDLVRGRLRLQDRTVPFGAAFGQLLHSIRMQRAADADPRVILSPRARSPYDAPRISKLVKTALIRGGVEGVTLDMLRRHGQQRNGKARLLQAADAMGYLTRNDAMELLSLSAAQAYERLRQLVEEGRLVKVGARYYPAGAVVPPREHAQKVCEYLTETGGAYRKELADILHLEARQCSRILEKLAQEGYLVREGQRYLPTKETGIKTDQKMP